MWSAILAILSQLLGLFTRKDERDIAEQTGEKLGVAETQAATAQETVKEARDANQTSVDVDRLAPGDLDRELREYQSK